MRPDYTMDWVVPRDDVHESIFRDLHRPTQLPHVAEFSPLVSGMLTNPNAPAVAPECSMPHVSCPPRNDFDYEYSLGASPEFDTDSADAHPNRQPEHEDDTSTHLRGTATSEDTSVGDPAAVNKSLSDRRKGASSLPADPSASGDSIGVARPTAVQKKEDLLKDDVKWNDVDDKSLSPLKATKAISKKKTTGKRVSTLANASGSVSPGTSANGAPSHTKMCRDRLNNMFEKLRQTLPAAPAGVEVKHKAQLLDYAIAVLRSMVDTTSRLEIELAVSSNKATMEWISKLVYQIDSFPDAACEVMLLFSRRRGWKHAELWLAGKRSCGPDASPEDSVVLTFGRFVTNDSLGPSTLEQFSKESESYAFKAKEGVLGRVWSSMRPEWVTGLTDLKNFQRASLAKEYGLKVCLALPVTIAGKIEAVMCFYDTKHRPYDTQCLELGMRLAWALGNAVGGKRAKVNVLTTSGTSST